MSQMDIRIGTLAEMKRGVGYLRQILPHGFESFSLTIWERIGGIDVERTAREVVDFLGDKAVISSVGLFGNPLQDEQTAKDIGRVIDACRLFGCDVVTGFAGAIEGKALPESMPQFKKVWAPLAKRAADKGVRIAWENCDMGGWWHDVRWNIAHSPTAWEMMFNEIPSDNIGLEWEPCHQMNSLIDPLPQLRKWVKKVFHVHGKDATVAWDVIKTSGIRGGKPYVWHRTPGFGDTNWTDVISILRMGGFKGRHRHRRLARPRLPRRPGNDRPGPRPELPQELPRRRLHRQPELNALRRLRKPPRCGRDEADHPGRTSSLDGLHRMTLRVRRDVLGRGPQFLGRAHAYRTRIRWIHVAKLLPGKLLLRRPNPVRHSGQYIPVPLDRHVLRGEVFLKQPPRRRRREAPVVGPTVRLEFRQRWHRRQDRPPPGLRIRRDSRKGRVKVVDVLQHLREDDAVVGLIGHGRQFAQVPVDRRPPARSRRS